MGYTPKVYVIGCGMTKVRIFLNMDTVQYSNIICLMRICMGFESVNMYYLIEIELSFELLSPSVYLLISIPLTHRVVVTYCFHSYLLLLHHITIKSG